MPRIPGEELPPPIPSAVAARKPAPLAVAAAPAEGRRRALAWQAESAFAAFRTAEEKTLAAAIKAISPEADIADAWEAGHGERARAFLGTLPAFLQDRFADRLDATGAEFSERSRAAAAREQTRLASETLDRTLRDTLLPRAAAVAGAADPAAALEATTAAGLRLIRASPALAPGAREAAAERWRRDVQRTALAALDPATRLAWLGAGAPDAGPGGKAGMRRGPDVAAVARAPQPATVPIGERLAAATTASPGTLVAQAQTTAPAELPWPPKEPQPAAGTILLALPGDPAPPTGPPDGGWQPEFDARGLLVRNRWGRPVDVTDPLRLNYGSVTTGGDTGIVLRNPDGSFRVEPFTFDTLAGVAERLTGTPVLFDGRYVDLEDGLGLRCLPAAARDALRTGLAAPDPATRERAGTLMATLQEGSPGAAADAPAADPGRVVAGAGDAGEGAPARSAADAGPAAPPPAADMATSPAGDAALPAPAVAGGEAATTGGAVPQEAALPWTLPSLGAFPDLPPQTGETADVMYIGRPVPADELAAATGDLRDGRNAFGTPVDPDNPDLITIGLGRPALEVLKQWIARFTGLPVIVDGTETREVTIDGMTTTERVLDYFAENPTAPGRTFETDDGRQQIVINGTLFDDVQAQAAAHELGHAIAEKILASAAGREAVRNSRPYLEGFATWWNTGTSFEAIYDEDRGALTEEEFQRDVMDHERLAEVMRVYIMNAGALRTDFPELRGWIVALLGKYPEITGAIQFVAVPDPAGAQAA